MGTLRFGVPELTVTTRGGTNPIGSLDPATSATFTRVLSDVGTAEVTITNPTQECCETLSRLRTVGHELVITRGGWRVWEGPITHIQWRGDGATVTARDVSWYLSRRAVQTRHAPDKSTDTKVKVLDMMGAVLHDSFGSAADGSDDPQGYNFARYTKLLRGPNDRSTKRKIPRFSGTVSDVVSQYLERGVLAYAVMGRRLLFWDTSTIPQTLPPMTDADFTVALSVEEDGEQLATRAYITDNDNDSKVTDIVEATAGVVGFYGYVDSVLSDVRENTESWQAQNRDRLDGMWPSPRFLVVPDGAGLLECSPVFLNDLQPGSVVEVTANASCVPMTASFQIQEVAVSWSLDSESVGLTFGPVAQNMAKFTSVEDIRAGMVPW